MLRLSSKNNLPNNLTIILILLFSGTSLATPSILTHEYHSLNGLKNQGVVGEGQRFIFHWKGADACVATGYYTYLDGSKKTVSNVNLHSSSRVVVQSDGSKKIDYITPSRTEAYSMEHSVECSDGSSSTNSSLVNRVYGKPSAQIAWNPQYVLKGGSARLTWSSSDATKCFINGVLRNTSGSWLGTNRQADQVTQYYCEGPGGRSDTLSVKLSVNAPPVVSGSMKSTFNDKEDITVSGTATDTDGSIKYLGFHLWDSNNKYLGKRSDYSSPYSANFGKLAPGRYRIWIRAEDNEGQIDGKAWEHYFNVYRKPSAQISWNPSTVDEGQSSTLSWSSTDATTCYINDVAKQPSGNWVGTNRTSNITTNFYCTGQGGSSEVVQAKLTVIKNAAPTVNAGADLNKMEWQWVSLAGQASDSDGSIVAIKWEQIAGEPVSNWSGKTELQTKFIVPRVNADSSVTFKLTVTDNKGKSASDTIKINLNDRAEIGSVSQPTSNAVLNPDNSFTVSVNNIADTSNTITAVKARSRHKVNNVWEYSTWYNLNLSADKKSAAINLGKPETLGLRSNILYQLQIVPIDNGSAGGWGWSKFVDFTVGIKPKVQLSWEPALVAEGGTADLVWNSTDADKCFINGEEQAISGRSPVRDVLGNKSATIKCTGRGGESEEVTQILEVVPSPKIIKHEYRSETNELNIGYVGEIQTFTFEWQNADKCFGYGFYTYDDGTTETVGPVKYHEISTHLGNNRYRVTTNPLRTKAYTMRHEIQCENKGFQSPKSVLTNVVKAAISAPTVQLSWEPALVAEGGTADLVWNSTDADKCFINGEEQAINGRSPVRDVLGNKSATIKCTGRGGESEEVTQTLEVVPSPQIIKHEYRSEMNELNIGYVGEIQTFTFEWENADKCHGYGFYTYEDGTTETVGPVKYHEIRGRENLGNNRYRVTTHPLRTKAYSMRHEILCENKGVQSPKSVLINQVKSNRPSEPPKLNLVESNLTWSTITNAESYELQHYACGESCGNYIETDWQLIQQNAATSFTLPNDDTKRAYRVKACFEGGSCSAWSNVWQPIQKKQIIFIHTDLLGSPVAETNENGDW